MIGDFLLDDGFIELLGYAAGVWTPWTQDRGTGIAKLLLQEDTTSTPPMLLVFRGNLVVVDAVVRRLLPLELLLLFQILNHLGFYSN